MMEGDSDSSSRKFDPLKFRVFSKLHSFPRRSPLTGQKWTCRHRRRKCTRPRRSQRSIRRAREEVSHSLPRRRKASAQRSSRTTPKSDEVTTPSLHRESSLIRRFSTAADFPAQTRSFPARSLEKTQSLPSNHPSFNTGSNQSNFFGRRDNELFAVEESFHLNRDSSRGSSSGVFSSGQGSGFLSGGGAGTRESTMDGFDMDEVFGPGSINSSQLDSQETVVPSQGTRAKRGHSRVEEEEGGGNEDSEMMEDEETGWNATVLPARKVRGAGARRSFKSAQSQPTLSFSTPF